MLRHTFEGISVEKKVVLSMLSMSNLLETT